MKYIQSSLVPYLIGLLGENLGNDKNVSIKIKWLFLTDWLKNKILRQSQFKVIFTTLLRAVQQKK